GLIVEIDEEEAAPGFKANRQETVVLKVEILDALHPRCGDQPAVEPIGPAMIGADDMGCAVPLAFQQLGATVPTAIGENAQLTLAVAQDDQRHAGMVDGEIIS